VAHAFAVKVHIGLGGDGYAVNMGSWGSCHSVGFRDKTPDFRTAPQALP
jgi:hypothetical protein